MREEYEYNKILTLGKKIPTAKKVIHLLYKKPVVDVNNVAEELGISKPTITSLLKDFVGLGILREITGQQRNRLYIYGDYLALF